MPSHLELYNLKCISVYCVFVNLKFSYISLTTFKSYHYKYNWFIFVSNLYNGFPKIQQCVFFICEWITGSHCIKSIVLVKRYRFSIECSLCLLIKHSRESENLIPKALLLSKPLLLHNNTCFYLTVYNLSHYTIWPSKYTLKALEMPQLVHYM